MARKSLTKANLRTLFARSGNRCAFPTCGHILVDEDGDFVAEICHIEAANSGGERFNPAMTDEQRSDPSNLMVMCHRHHVKTNNVDTYTVEVLKRIKAEHEANFSEAKYSIPDEALDAILEEELNFAHKVGVENTKWRETFDLAMEVEIPSDPIVCLRTIEKEVGWLGSMCSDISDYLAKLPDTVRAHLVSLGYNVEAYDSVPYYKSPISNVFWEALNIGVPNARSKIGVNVEILEVLLLQRLLRDNPGDHELEQRLNTARATLLESARRAGYTD